MLVSGHAPLGSSLLKIYCTQTQEHEGYIIRSNIYCTEIQELRDSDMEKTPNGYIFVIEECSINLLLQ